MGFVLLITMIPVKVTRGRVRRIRLCAQKADTSELEGQGDLATSPTWFMEEKIFRDLGGVGVFMASIALPGWHVLPVFLDLKLANDPALPGLTAETLPITTTAIFLGWLASATVLDRFLEVFDKKQLLLLHVMGLLLVNLATITLPYLTAGNLMVFTALRFVYGLLMNIAAIAQIYIQENMPPGRGNQALVMLSIIYSISTILMSWCCGNLTLTMDWRFEVFLWCGLPLMAGVLMAFPNWWQIVQSLPLAVTNRRVDEGRVEESISDADQRNIVALALGFLACGCGFYGLTYSAGQLSPSVYLSCMLLHAGDIFGYLLALSADSYGRNNVQACGFFLASICLILCSTGEPGTPFVLSAAVLGRVCLDVCFTTVYVGLAELFDGASSRSALKTCETTARLGGIVAPLSGTLPPSISCSFFASICLAAACSSMTLRNKTTKDSTTQRRSTSLSRS